MISGTDFTIMISRLPQTAEVFFNGFLILSFAGLNISHPMKTEVQMTELPPRSNQQ